MSPVFRIEDAERFWRKVRRAGVDECWEWTGARREARGYGLFWFGDRLVRAHRVAWQLANGRPIGSGLVICHHCDNPPCVNPAHLFAGTPADNTRDMFAKNRANTAVGEQRRAKLTVSDVLEIRRLVAGGLQKKVVAARYSLAPSRVSQIASRQAWAHVPEEVSS